MYYIWFVWVSDGSCWVVACCYKGPRYKEGWKQLLYRYSSELRSAWIDLRTPGIIFFANPAIQSVKHGTLHNHVTFYNKQRSQRRKNNKNGLFSPKGGYPNRSPWGSNSFAILRASELARSELAGETARMRQLSLQTNWLIMSRICCSISAGWSPTGTLVIPGRSTRVRFNTASMKSIGWVSGDNDGQSTDRSHRTLAAEINVLFVQSEVIAGYCCVSGKSRHQRIWGPLRSHAETSEIVSEVIGQIRSCQR